jgi:hypothetical protein
MTDWACRFDGDKNAIINLVGKPLENANLQVQYGEDADSIAAEEINREGLCPVL